MSFGKTWVTDGDEGIRRIPLQAAGLGLLRLSFQTIGIIYSDIGTSPLYVLNGIWPASGSAPPAEDVIGGISAIIWSLTLLPFIKYVIFGLRFGTSEGEGGTFALFHGIFPPAVPNYEEERTLTVDSSYKTTSSSEQSVRGGILNRCKPLLLVWTLFGTSLTLADGMLTPAVSVTSAVAGIAITAPSLSDNISAISIGFVVALFLVQRIGTTKLGAVFSPVTATWLLLLLGTGIYNITFYPAILRAFDPSRAVAFFIRTKKYDHLAGILLAVTGCEALFANLGQFNMLSIQLSFACFTYPALVFAYLGQGAKLVESGDAVLANVFYLTIPGGAGKPLYWIVYVFAILATLVASQAMITATFSLIQQVINMKSLPPLRMHYTSETIQGQIYIPTINWILCAGTIILILIFKDLAKLTYAYGFAVATVMFITTTLIAIQIPYVKHKPWILAVAWLLFFGFIDGLFWGASIRKVPHGAWVPLLVGSVSAIFMAFWTWAKSLEDKFDGANRQNLKHFISVALDEEPQQQQGITSANAISRPTTGNEEIQEIGRIRQRFSTRINKTLFLETTTTAVAETKPGATPDSADSTKEKTTRMILNRIPTCAIFHKLSHGGGKGLGGVPHTFVGFLRQWPVLPKVVIFLSLRVMPIARVDPEEKYRVTKVRSLPGFYGITYQKGFRDKFKIDVDDIVGRICSLERALALSSGAAMTTATAITAKATGTSEVDDGEKGKKPGLKADGEPEDNDTITEILNAAQNVTHIVPHYHVLSRRVQGVFGAPLLYLLRRVLIEDVYRNIAYVFPETVNWRVSADKIIHVGVTAAI